IMFKGRCYYLGGYSQIEEAAKARRQAEERIYGEFLEWYYSTHLPKKGRTAIDTREEGIHGAYPVD
ncbi:MAG: hypothetical protein Q4C91_22055, partial [Eubacteriales bacterium]|nr:hypothetical protein [Eubacteriales bacterium]